jgi:hypothetical protein
MRIHQPAAIILALLPSAAFAQVSAYEPNPGKSGIDLGALADPAAHSFWSGGHRHRWLKSAIKMMMGMGTPSIKSKIERI